MMWILRILSLPGALFLNDLNVENVSIGFIVRICAVFQQNNLTSSVFGPFRRPFLAVSLSVFNVVFWQFSLSLFGP